MYHVGRPAKTVLPNAFLAGLGHRRPINSHTKHSARLPAREGYQLWMGLDRSPVPIMRNAKVILLI